MKGLFILSLCAVGLLAQEPPEYQSISRLASTNLVRLHPLTGEAVPQTTFTNTYVLGGVTNSVVVTFNGTPQASRPAPTNCVLSWDDGFVRWDAVFGAVNYKVRWGKTKLLAQQDWGTNEVMVNTPLWNPASLPLGTNYLTVAAVDARGNYSDPSVPLELEIFREWAVWSEVINVISKTNAAAKTNNAQAVRGSLLGVTTNRQFALTLTAAPSRFVTVQATNTQTKTFRPWTVKARAVGR